MTLQQAAPADRRSGCPGAGATLGAASGPSTSRCRRLRRHPARRLRRPEGQDDVIPFLRNVTRGRGIPDERLEEVAHHYRHFGGVSPINAQNRALKAALEAELAARGIDLPVLWGNRNWDPYLDDAVAEAHEAGAHHAARASPRAPTARTPAAASTARTSPRRWPRPASARRCTIDKVRQFFDHPGFVAALRRGRAGRPGRAAAARGIAAAEIARAVLRPTPSRPTDAELRGPRDRRLGPRRGLRRAAPGGRRGRHRARPRRRRSPGSSSTSRARGPPQQPWLEPDINDAIAALPERPASRRS